MIINGLGYNNNYYYSGNTAQLSFSHTHTQTHKQLIDIDIRGDIKNV